MGAQVFAAGSLLVDGARLLRGGALLVHGGRVVRPLADRTAVRRAVRGGARLRDLGPGLIAPGLVNAHAHLELSGVAGLLPSSAGEEEGDFARWVAALLERRGPRSREALAADVRRGAARCLATGTTTVGDVEGSGHGGAPLARWGPRLTLYREVLDALDASRTGPALARVRRALRRRVRVSEGLSPHAPFTVSDDLLAGLGALVRRRPRPVAVHWAESLDELRWQRDGAGPLRRLVPGPPPDPPLARLAEAGLLGPSTALVHGNQPLPGDRERIARAGVHLVHCPGSHAFFGRAPFPFALWRAAGVPVALGTDSLASNVDLDMRREMALARAAAPELAPEEVWDMGTVASAAALGRSGEVGALRPGARADFCLYAAGGGERRAVLEALTSERIAVLGTWVGGRRQALARSMQPPVDPAGDS